MTTYATTENFINAFGEREIVFLTNLHTSGGTTINEDILQKNQAKAFGLINTYVGSCVNYVGLLPFQPPYPTLLVGFELDMTRYYLDSIDTREDVRKRFEDAIGQLKQIGRCELGLGIIENVPQIPGGDNPVKVSAPTRVFTVERLGAFLRGFP